MARRLGATLTREPGGTPLGERIRALVLDPELGQVAARTEALLMAADRAQHIAEVVEPVLAGGGDVVSDRYLYSSVAYQGHGRQLDPETIRRLSLWAVDDLLPDLVLFLAGPARLASRTRVDRLEAEDDAFRTRVAAGYQAQLADGPRPVGGGRRQRRRGRHRRAHPRRRRGRFGPWPAPTPAQPGDGRPAVDRPSARSPTPSPTSWVSPRPWPSCVPPWAGPCTPTCSWGRRAPAPARRPGPSPASCWPADSDR